MTGSRLVVTSSLSLSIIS